MFHSHCVTVTLTLSDTFKQFTEANIALRFRSTLRKKILSLVGLLRSICTCSNRNHFQSIIDFQFSFSTENETATSKRQKIFLGLEKFLYCRFLLKRSREGRCFPEAHITCVARTLTRAPPKINVTCLMLAHLLTVSFCHISRKFTKERNRFS